MAISKSQSNGTEYVPSKASNWVSIYPQIIKLGGQEGIDKIKAALSEEDRTELFSKCLLSISVINFNSFLRFQFAADALLGQGDGKLMESLNKTAAEKQLSGIYKFLVKMSSPESLIKSAPKIFKQQFQRGKIEVVKNGPNHMSLVYSDVPLVPGHEKAFIPYHERALQLAGAKNLKITHPYCVCRGHDNCVYDYIWD